MKNVTIIMSSDQKITQSMNDAVKEAREKLVSKFELDDSLTKLQIEVKIRKTGKMKVEGLLFTKKNTFKISVEGDDFYELLNQIVHSFERMITKKKEKVIEKRRKIKRPSYSSDLLSGSHFIEEDEELIEEYFEEGVDDSQ